MKKVVRLTESDLKKIVLNILKEDEDTKDENIIDCLSEILGVSDEERKNIPQNLISLFSGKDIMMDLIKKGTGAISILTQNGINEDELNDIIKCVESKRKE